MQVEFTTCGVGEKLSLLTHKVPVDYGTSTIASDNSLRHPEGPCVKTLCEPKPVSAATLQANH